MKILVMSDSHSAMHFMRRCVEVLRPDAVIHLGDHFDDAQTLAEEYPQIPVHQVPGNCDRYRTPPGQREILCYDIGGVRLYMTHGHMHNVKFGIGRLLADARAMGAAAVLYGHTHVADNHREPDGLWVLNPGPATYAGGAGLLETEHGAIKACRLIKPVELEETI